MPDGTCATSDEAALPKLLSAALGRDVRFAGAGEEGSAPASAEDYQADADEVIDFELPSGTFVDCAPVHLVTTATLDRLRSLYPVGRFEPRRFRPNIIVATGPGTEGFVENDWVGRTVEIGDSVLLRVFMTTGRCVMTTLPQFDLPKDSGILRTAVQHNNAADRGLRRGGPRRQDPAWGPRHGGVGPPAGFGGWVGGATPGAGIENQITNLSSNRKGVPF